MAMTKGKRKKSFCSYVLEITEWEMPYSFSTGRARKVAPASFWEHAAIRLKAKVLFPKTHVDKIVDVYILGHRDFNQIQNNPEKYPCYEPEAIGTLKIRGQDSEFLGSLPQDMFGQIATLLACGVYRYVELYGHTLYRGYADIVSLRFERDIDPEDY